MISNEKRIGSAESEEVDDRLADVTRDPRSMAFVMPIELIGSLGRVRMLDEEHVRKSTWRRLVEGDPRTRAT